MKTAGVNAVRLFLLQNYIADRSPSIPSYNLRKRKAGASLEMKAPPALHPSYISLKPHILLKEVHLSYLQLFRLKTEVATFPLTGKNQGE